MIELGRLYASIGTWLPRWKPLILSSSGISYRPLLATVDYSSQCEISGRMSDDNPTFALDYIDRSTVEKRLIRKLDLRVAFLVLVYIMNYMDRTNAALRGYEEDLGMTGNQFNTLISILYVGYLLTQAPSNMILHHMKRPSLYLSSCMAIWGVLTVSTGAVQTYHAALILRFFIGFVEAAFFPGAVFLLSRWYKRNELGLRTALLTCGASISNAFGALFASGILGSLDGTLGFTAWRWLFFVEGALTIVIAVSAAWILPDFPSTPNLWLLPDEQILAKQRMDEEVASENEHKSKPEEYYFGLVEALMDWRVWWVGAALNLMSSSQSFGLFFPDPSSYNGLQRDYEPLALRTSVDFGNCNLICCGQSPVAYVVCLTWVMNTFSQSQSKRAAAIALVNTLSTASHMGSSYFWPSSWGPSYVNSYLICILTSVLCIAMLWVFRTHLSRCNEAAEAEEQSLGLPKGLRYIL
ncbi:MFS general substrate transporter [Suillus subalutaceus]|uniref:MFS general substrate transporter n=1 Tax=Suillus subalutaceus TaxID=48586 RepID=UPI001B873456|nr:MFS general substrate transporter [Suillus subalutaceus]KAG1845720.1 MFS general substrate transporter [Suillus subalutaceus]